MASTKLYSFNMERNGHNIDSARTLLRLRWYDAVEAGDHAAADRLQARIDRINEIVCGCFAGMLQLPWDEWQYLHTVSEWYKTHRMCCCEAHGIEYVE